MQNGYYVATIAILVVGLLIATAGLALLVASLTTGGYAFGWDFLAIALGLALVFASGFILTVGHFTNRDRNDRERQS
jgi:hypothetical protein